MAAVYPETWEQHLHSLATPATPPALPLGATHAADPALLERAYAYCEAVTAEHSRSFHFASRLLPPDKRRAIRALYAFCHVINRLVDCPQGDVAQLLAAWRTRALSNRPAPSDLVSVAWTDTRLRYGIPTSYAEQLIDGVARDLKQTRYQTFEELAAYAYGVASTVGLMSMHIIGCTSEEAIPYVIKLGVALQFTNILRDVGEDWRAGRVYLPQEELALFGLSDEDIARGTVDARWREFMRYQIACTRDLYAQALPGIRKLNADSRPAVAAAAELHRAILDDIEAHDYDVFHRRARVGNWGTLRQLPSIYWWGR